jgi:hypothetical protein
MALTPTTAYSTHAKPTSSRKQRQRFDSKLRLPKTLDWGHHHQQQQQQQQHEGEPVHCLPTNPQQQSQQGQLQQQQRLKPGGLTRQQAVQIPEGELMALVAAARSISDIERLVLQYHTQFK